MNESKEYNKILDEIIKELNIVKSKSIDTSVSLYEQTNKINTVTSNIEDVAYQTEVSKWQLNYIDSTFAKLYKKINNYPIRENTTNFLKLFSLKGKILGMGFNKNNQSDFIEKDTKIDNSKLDKIENILNDIKSITNVNNEELTKQNYMLEYNNELVESSQDKISKNTRKIKKLLN
tara:strand:- start:379 stop:906 length:528 start_codon:yes stop_codon:yes gene_type:complete